ncbi:endo-1-3(4)-beta-glucanase [Penicillium herquei]|nr:endo-1-3(4)-beta-glucanase [Penicillium herquei]
MRFQDPYRNIDDEYSRFGGATSRLPQFDNHNYDPSGNSGSRGQPSSGSGWPGYETEQGLPPRYSTVAGARPGPGAQASYAWYNPRGWSLRKKLIVAGCIAVVIIAIIVGAVEGVKANAAYPDYSQLNYTLVDTYSGTDFFDNFVYYTAADTTDGFVQYVDSQTASQLNLTYASDSSAVLRVDTDSSNQTSGRKSVRITSNNQYYDGLFIFDIVHTPYGCATWPALWLTDPDNWPEHGEIDVLESNNKATHGNAMTLHTSSGCKMNVKRKETGSANYANCLNTANDNAGCGVDGKQKTYGQEFNENGGGVYAMELREAGIRVWMFARDDIPNDISNSSTTPDPSTWGEALADFPSTNCNITSHFKNQSIIANIDICGDLAGSSTYYTDLYDCPGTCTEWAAENGSNFTSAYWEFNSFKVYQSS